MCARSRWVGVRWPMRELAAGAGRADKFSMCHLLQLPNMGILCACICMGLGYFLCDIQLDGPRCIHACAVFSCYSCTGQQFCFNSC